MHRTNPIAKTKLAGDGREKQNKEKGMGEAPAATSRRRPRPHTAPSTGRQRIIPDVGGKIPYKLRPPIELNPALLVSPFNDAPSQPSHQHNSGTTGTEEGGSKEDQKPSGFLTWHHLPPPKNTSTPPPRQGHAAHVLEEGGGGREEKKMYVFGGLVSGKRSNSLFALDLKTRIWKELKPGGEIPCPRAWFASCVVQAEASSSNSRTSERLLIHSGETDDFVLPLLKQKLPSPVMAEGNRPRPIPKVRPHDEADEDRGPEDQEQGGRICADDLVCYDPQANSWTYLPTLVSPLPRRLHTLTVMKGGKLLVLFGGLRAGGRGASNEIYTLPVNKDLFEGKGIWTKVVVDSSCPSISTQPSPRFGHTCTALSSTTLLVYGGRTQQGEVLNDLYMLDITTMAWTHIIKSVGKPPQARWGHQACLAPIPSTNCIDEPKSKHSHTSNLHEQKEGETDSKERRRRGRMGLLVFGGALRIGQGKHARVQYSHDLYLYDPEKYQWSEVATSHAFPPSRANASLALFSSSSSNSNITTSNFGAKGQGGKGGRLEGGEQGWKPPRLYADGRVVEKDAEDLIDPGQQVTGCKFWAILFGGLNSMYCASDAWMLELQWSTREQAAGTYMTSLLAASPLPESSLSSSVGTAPHPPCDYAQNLHHAQVEARIAQREYVLECRKRMMLEKKYAELETYCSTIQGQLKVNQGTAQDGIRRLQEALVAEQAKSKALTRLNTELHALLVMLELSKAMSWGSSGAALLNQTPQVKSFFQQANNKAQQVIDFEKKHNLQQQQQQQLQHEATSNNNSIRPPPLSIPPTINKPATITPPSSSSSAAISSSYQEGGEGGSVQPSSAFSSQPHCSPSQSQVCVLGPLPTTPPRATLHVDLLPPKTPSTPTRRGDAPRPTSSLHLGIIPPTHHQELHPHPQLKGKERGGEEARRRRTVAAGEQGEGEEGKGELDLLLLQQQQALLVSPVGAVAGGSSVHSPYSSQSSSPYSSTYDETSSMISTSSAASSPSYQADQADGIEGDGNHLSLPTRVLLTSSKTSSSPLRSPGGQLRQVTEESQQKDERKSGAATGWVNREPEREREAEEGEGGHVRQESLPLPPLSFTINSYREESAEGPDFFELYQQTRGGLLEQNQELKNKEKEVNG